MCIQSIPSSKTAPMLSAEPDPLIFDTPKNNLKFDTQVSKNKSHEKRPEMIPMMSRKKNNCHGFGPARGEDQKALDVFFKESPKCPVCNGLYQTGTLSSWIDGHILDCRISRPQYNGSFDRSDADSWFSKTYLPWVKEKFGVELS